MTVTKAWAQSTTVWGLLVIVVGAALVKFGLPVELADSVSDAVGNVVEVVGVLIAAYGRSKAAGPLSGVLPS
jgi:hypothetical protein